nr:MAG TPA_asm: hypothetical protein [Bacteriophage sp.]
MYAVTTLNVWWLFLIQVIRLFISHCNTGRFSA